MKPQLNTQKQCYVKAFDFPSQATEFMTSLGQENVITVTVGKRHDGADEYYVWYWKTIEEATEGPQSIMESN